MFDHVGHQSARIYDDSRANRLISLHAAKNPNVASVLRLKRSKITIISFMRELKNVVDRFEKLQMREQTKSLKKLTKSHLVAFEIPLYS